LTILDVRHTTVYRYRRPVRLGDHRLMLRPRDSHDLRLIETSLNLSPPASIRWTHDVFGNSTALASFTDPTSELRIESILRLETFAVRRPVFQITPEAVSYPFIYSADDRIDLGRLLDRQYPDPTDRLGAWARGFVRSSPTDTLALWADLKPANKAERSAAELAEPRAGTEGNVVWQITHRTQRQVRVSKAPDRMRQLLCRSDPRWEPYAGKPPVRDLCGGREVTRVPTANRVAVPS
jgi:transglutaminase-like putative cysteine protease